MDRRLDNYYLYLHLDKQDISVMGYPWHNQHLVEQIPVLALLIARSLPNARICKPQHHDSLLRQKQTIRYTGGRITIRYDKVFLRSPDATKDQSFKKYRMATVIIENHDKLDYGQHHEVLRLVDKMLRRHWTTQNFHIRRCEIAADNLDREAGTYLAMAMVPARANIEGWECKNIDGVKVKRKAWVELAEGQYYWGTRNDESKSRSYRRREWNPHVHWYQGIPIWRIELRLSRKYLYDAGISNHDELLGAMERLFTNNVRFMRPELERIRGFLIRCRQARKHPEFTKKSWSSYLEWERYSTCAWMSDLEHRIGSTDRLFRAVEYPSIDQVGHQVQVAEIRRYA